MRLPATGGFDEESEEKEGGVLERIYLVETALKATDHLFAFSLKWRLTSPVDIRGNPRIKTWLKASSAWSDHGDR